MADRIFERMREHREDALAACGKDWFVHCLQGSQNYGLSDTDSDIDTKLLTIPSMSELVLNEKSTNFTHIMVNDEHCDVKDTREYFKIFRKSNINFVEILFTDWAVVNPDYTDLWEVLQKNRENLARINPYAAVSCMKGMALEKKHALCHEYPSRMCWINKYGYDPKQLSHILRIYSFISKYVHGFEYKKCLDEHDNTYLLDLKRGNTNLSKEEAIEMAEEYCFLISDIAEDYRENLENKNNPEMDALLNDVLYKLVTRSLRKELERI